MNEFQGCPGSRTMDLRSKDDQDSKEGGSDVQVESQLRQWPIQMHLVSPQAPYFENADVLLAADCVPFAMGNFHSDYLKGNSLAIGCPKLDQGQDIYLAKLKSLIEDAKINTLTVMIMQVPCCSGLLALAKQALASSDRKIPLKAVVVGLQGDVLSEEWASV